MNGSSTLRAAFLMFAVLAFAVVPCVAGEILTFTGGTFTNSVNNQTIGWSFTVNSALHVSDLSWYDPTGLNTVDRAVGIWDSNGNLVVSTCVGPGCGSTYQSPFWVTLASADLLPGNYVIGGYVYANGADGFVLGDPTITTDPRITYGQSLFAVSGSLTEPNDHCCGNGFFGPDFSVGGSQVPEPATLAFAGIGLGVTAIKRRLRSSSR